MKNLAPTDTFHIAFDTKTMPSKIIVTTVKLTREIVDKSCLQQAFRVDLCDHPLYPQLARYVAENPVRK